MSSLLDVVGSVVLFGALLLVVLKLNGSLIDSNSQQNLRVMSGEQIGGVAGAAGLAQILERDFSLAGARTTTPITLADSNRITLQGDIDGNGTIDSVKYSLVALAIPAGGNTKLTHRLIRRQNTETGASGGIGVSLFKMVFLDSLGRPMVTPVSGAALTKIRSIRVRVCVENPVRIKNDIDTSFASAYYERVFSPRNLRTVK